MPTPFAPPSPSSCRSWLRSTTALRGGLASLLLAAALAPSSARANPEGATVVGGDVTIARTSDKRLDITQTSGRGIINWRSFSIGADEHTNFNQPSSSAVTLNRVTGGNPSEILGRLTANGHVWLVNPNGVFFGPGARVDVNGLIATTHDIKNEDFMAGRYVFQSDTQPPGIVENQGRITAADAGLVAFVAPGVVNHGVISARLGEVALASGNKFTVDFYGDQKINLAMDSKTTEKVVGRDGQPLKALVHNDGQIFADGGRVTMTAAAAKGVADTLVHAGGLIQARGVEQKNGEIVLTGDDGGAVEVTGTLDVSGRSPGQTGGRVVATADSVAVRAGARIDASGAAGGGDILIGGDVRGGGATEAELAEYRLRPGRKPVAPARAVDIEAGATLVADALDTGNGGTVVAWGEQVARVSGSLSARGGANGGDGGFIETSGHLLAIDGISLDASAPRGKGGNWLLDPFNVSIVGDATPTSGTDYGISYNPAATSVIHASDIAHSLSIGGGISVTIATGGAGTDKGDINVQSAIVKSAGTDASLILKADGNIYVAADITSTSGKLNMLFDSRASGGTVGSVSIFRGVTVNSNGGDITIGGGTYSAADPAGTIGAAIGNYTTYANTGVVPLDSLRGVAVNGTLAAAGGNIVIKGEGCPNTTGCLYSRGVSIGGTVSTTGSGTITITGTGTANSGATAGSDGIGLGDTRYYSTGSPDSAYVTATIAGSISAQNGTVTLNGTRSAYVGAYGVDVPTGNSISITGTGTLVVNGSGGNLLLNGLSFAAGSSFSVSGGTVTATATSGPMKITSATLDGDGIFTTQAGDITVAGNITQNSSGPKLLKLSSYRDVIVQAGSHITSAGGVFNTKFLSDNTGLGVGGISFDTGSTVSTRGGSILLAGGTNGDGAATGSGANPNVTGINGITLDGVQFTSAGGAITLRGTSGNGTQIGANAHDALFTTDGAWGIAIGGATTLDAGGGAISMTGTSVGTDGGLLRADGIEISGTTSITTSGTGTISLTGDASAASDGSEHAYGVSIRNGVTVTSADGTISLTGTGGIGENDNSTDGVYLDGTVKSGTGAITLTGTGGDGTASAYGISLGANAIIGGATTSGDINMSTDKLFLSQSITADAVKSSGNLTIAPKSPSLAIKISSTLQGITDLGLRAAWFNGGGIASGFNRVTIGSTAGSGGLLVNAALTSANDLQLLAGSGNLAINRALVATGKKLTLQTTGTATQAPLGTITADSLELLGAGGSFTLTNTANSIGTLAANTGSVDFVNKGSLVVGTVNSTNGLAAAGTVRVTVAADDTGHGDLTLSQAISSSSSAGAAIVLATAGKFVNTAGATALSAESSRWIVYSADSGADTPGGLTGANLYGCTTVTCAVGTIAVSHPGTFVSAAARPVVAAALLPAVENRATTTTPAATPPAAAAALPETRGTESPALTVADLPRNVIVPYTPRDVASPVIALPNAGASPLPALPTLLEQRLPEASPPQPGRAETPAPETTRDATPVQIASLPNVERLSPAPLAPSGLGPAIRPGAENPAAAAANGERAPATAEESGTRNQSTPAADRDRQAPEPREEPREEPLAALLSGETSGRGDAAAVAEDFAAALRGSGLAPADAQAVAAGAAAAMAENMARGMPAAEARAAAEQGLSAAAEQIKAATVADSRAPAVLLGASLAGGAGGNHSVREALGGDGATGTRSHEVAEHAMAAALASGASPGSALAAARSAGEASRQQLEAAAVPLTATGGAMASLAGESAGGVQGAMAALTSGMGAEQKAAFANSLSSLLAQGVDPVVAAQLAAGQAEAAADMAARAAVPADRASTLVQSLSAGLTPDALLAAMGVDGGRDGAAGQAALRSLNEALARGEDPATALGAAQAAARAAAAQELAAAVISADTADIAAFAGGTERAAAISALIGKLDPRAPETAALAQALSDALAGGLSGAASLRAAEAAVRAARDQLAAAQVALAPHADLIQAVATGNGVIAAAERTVPALAGGDHPEQPLLYQGLLRALGRGESLVAAVDTAQDLAQGADHHLARVERGVPRPDPDLVARATGVTPPPPAPGSTPDAQTRVVGLEPGK